MPIFHDAITRGNEGIGSDPAPLPVSGGGMGPILKELGIPWPEADTTALRDAAALWQRLAATIRENQGHANQAATSISGANAGAAIDAFESYWAKFGDSKGALPLGADACENMANACTQYASQIDSVKQKIAEKEAELAGSMVLGVAVAVFTDGAAAGTAEYLAGSLAGWIEDIGLSLSVSLTLVTDGVTELYGVVDAIVGTIAGATGVLRNAVAVEAVSAVSAAAMSNFTAGIASSVVTTPLNDLIEQQPLSEKQAAAAILKSGLGNAADGVVGVLGELSAPQLSRLLSNASEVVATSNPYLYVSMQMLSQQVSGMAGKIGTAVLASAAGQLVSSQSVSAQGSAQDGLQELLQAAIDHNAGEGGGE